MAEKAVSPGHSIRPGDEFEYRRPEAFFPGGFTAAILLVQDNPVARRQVAEQVDTAAQSALGALYAGGSVGPKDYVLARIWTNIAIANGIEEAGEFRGKLKRDMFRAEIRCATELARACMDADYQDCLQ